MNTTNTDRSTLQQRRTLLHTIARKADVDEPNADYDNEHVISRIAEDAPLERFVAISADETYTFLHFAETLEQAAGILAEGVHYGTGNVPVVVIDLDTAKSYTPKASIALEEAQEQSWYLQ